jgi:hypothetical protein
LNVTISADFFEKIINLNIELGVFSQRKETVAFSFLAFITQPISLAMKMSDASANELISYSSLLFKDTPDWDKYQYPNAFL